MSLPRHGVRIVMQRRGLDDLLADPAVRVAEAHELAPVAVLVVARQSEDLKALRQPLPLLALAPVKPAFGQRELVRLVVIRIARDGWGACRVG